MPAFSGRYWQIGLGHQTAEGSLINPTQMFKWGDGSGVDPDVKWTDEYEGDGSIDMSFVNKDSSMWKGKLKYLPRSTDLGVLLSMIAGTSSETLKSAPVGMTATATTGGTIPDGTYHYAIAFLYGSVEGPLSVDLSVTIAAGNSTTTIATIPADAAATGIRIYKGDIAGASGTYTHYADVAVATSVTDSGTVPTFAAYPAPTGTTANATTGKLHYFTPQVAADFWTCEFGMTQGPTNRVRGQIADCYPMTLTITGEPNKPVTVEFDFIGKYAQAISSLTSAVFDSQSRPLIMSNATFVIDGAPSVYVAKFQIKIEVTTSQDIFTGATLWPLSFIEEKRKASLDATLIFQDASDYYKYLSGGSTTNPTAGTIIDNAAISTGTFDLRLLTGGTDVTNAFGITLNNVSYKPVGPKPSLNGKRFDQPISGYATRSTNPIYTAQLRNAQATAY